ncbi:MAG: flagellar biosynthesis protein FlhF [Bacillota bacterium]
MRIKRYVAPSMQQALERVREEMGDGALIVQTRRLRSWWRPWGQEGVEVIAAVEPRTAVHPPAPPRPAEPRAGAPRAPVPPGRQAPLDGIGSNSHANRPAPPAAAGRSAPDLRAQETVWFDRLTQCDVEASLAWEMVQKAALLARSSGMKMVRALLEQVESSVPTAPLWERDRHPRFVMLVGPTGVGKTTTLAKLAANFALIGGWQVGLVTADTFRIGAVHQLRTYAELTGLPLWVAQDSEQLRDICRAATQELVLIDTAGHSPSDRRKLEQTLALTRSLAGETAVMLVVPAAARQADLMEMVEAYRPLKPSGVIVTKVDETRRRGALLNAPRWAGQPLAFITTGQTVPDDIEVADGNTVARWLLRDWIPESELPGERHTPAGERAPVSDGGG